MGTLFVISGPSGVGKGTLVKLLLEEDSSLALSVSCTTRQPRAGEREGKEYFFLSKEEFLRRRDENGFLEWDEHFGNFYGTPKPFVLEMLKERSVILEIDVRGAMQVREALKGSGISPVLIMIAPPNEEALIDRLEGRASESEEELKTRLDRARYELSKSVNYDYLLVNDELDAAKNRLKDIIETEKSKRRL